MQLKNNFTVSKTKDWSSHCRLRHSFTFCYEGVYNRISFKKKKKQVLLLISLRPCFFKNKNYEQFLMKKIFIQKLFVVLKLSAFYFEINSFSSPGCCISLILHLLQLVCAIQSVAQFYRCKSRVQRFKS